MSVEVVPEWFSNLDDEDLSFIKKFILASGSLKEIAEIYGVTYPTVRLKLDKIIQKIQISDDTQNEPYISLIKRLAVNEKIDFDTAKILISEYKKTKTIDEKEEDSTGSDPLLKPAIEVAIKSGKISTSLIQRRLSIGYGHATRLIELMEKMGIVSASDGQGPRNVLINNEGV